MLEGVVPVIGITSNTERYAQRYIRAVEARGALSQILLPGPLSDPRLVLERLDGLLLAGGEDVDPVLYGELPQANAGLELNRPRDAYEFSLLRGALEMDLPVLAICRGMQVLNVVMGGRLIQDLPGHTQGEGGSAFHQLYIAPGSKLAAVLGTGGFFWVNSRHHQGLKEPQRSARVLASAYSLEDGLIEGLESPTHRWVIGVQCHPEREEEVPQVFGRLFQSLVWAAQQTRVAGTR